MSRSPVLQLSFLLLGHLGLVVGYAWVVPPWEAPDEPAHYRRVRGLACRLAGDATEACRGGPILGDAGRRALASGEDCTSPRVDPGAEAAWTPRSRLLSSYYENYHPPLGHALYAPWFLLTGPWDPVFLMDPDYPTTAPGVFLHDLDNDPAMSPWIRRLRWLRLPGLCFGLVTVAATWAAGRRLMPERPDLALAGGAVIAFLPQFGFVAGTMNNEIPAAAGGALLIAWLTTGLGRERPVHPLPLGLGAAALLAATLAIRPNALALVGLVLLAMLVSVKRRGGIRHMLAFALAAAALLVALAGIARAAAPSLWSLLAGHLSGRMRLGDAQAGPAALVGMGRSFVGQFGWLDVRLPEAAYVVCLALAGASALGVGRLLLRPPAWLAPHRRTLLAVLAAGMALSVIPAWLNATSIGQAQGRYLFPGLAGFGILAGAGLGGLTSPRVGRPVAWMLAWLLLLADALALGAVLAPAYDGPPSGSWRRLEASRGALLLQGGGAAPAGGLLPDRGGRWLLHRLPGPGARLEARPESRPAFDRASGPSAARIRGLGATVDTPAGPPELVPALRLPGGFDLLERATGAPRETPPEALPGIRSIGGRGPGESVARRVFPGPMTIQDRSRAVLFAHPVTRLDLDPFLASGTVRLEAEVGIDPRAWSDTDGVTFRLLEAGAGVLAGRHLDPRSRPADRGWLLVSGEVRVRGEAPVQVRLETLPGPGGSLAFDWAAWSSVRLHGDAPVRLPLSVCRDGEAAPGLPGDLGGGTALTLLAPPDLPRGAGLELVPVDPGQAGAGRGDREPARPAHLAGDGAGR